MPYWALGLRTPTGMADWAPGAPQRTVAALPEVDIAPVLRMAARHTPDTAIHATLMDFARRQLADAATYAADQIDIIGDYQKRAAIDFAAVPAPVFTPESGRPDSALVKAGWLHVLDLTDDDAYAAVEALTITGEDDKVLPASAVAVVKADEPGAADWIALLQPTTKTAQFALFDTRRIKRTLVDPLTTSVVADDGEGMSFAAAPSQITSPSPLAAVERWPDRAWIICEDGDEYLCPASAGEGVNWGYSGGGPVRLAEVLNALLDDINTEVAQIPYERPAGLIAVCEHAWEPGTVLTRAQLERAKEA